MNFEQIMNALRQSEDPGYTTRYCVVWIYDFKFSFDGTAIQFKLKDDNEELRQYLLDWLEGQQAWSTYDAETGVVEVTTDGWKSSNLLEEKVYLPREHEIKLPELKDEWPFLLDEYEGFTTAATPDNSYFKNLTLAEYTEACEGKFEALTEQPEAGHRAPQIDKLYRRNRDYENPLDYIDNYERRRAGQLPR